MTRGVDDILADLAEAADAAAELVRLGKERWDAQRPLRLAGEAVIGRLGDIATKLPDEVIKATPLSYGQDEDEIDQMAATRMQRQQVLYQPAKPVQVVMLEGALRACRVGAPR